MPFSWMLLYLQLFIFALQFIPMVGFITIKFALWLPNDPLLTMMPTGSRTDVFIPSFHIFQLLSYHLLNTSILMLALNLFGLYTCATILEDRWGEKRFLFFYIVCAFGDGILQLLVSALTHSGGFVFGAAGPLFGALMAVWLLHRDEPIEPPWLPKMQVTSFVIGLAVMHLILAKGSQSFLVQIVHLISGALFGWLLLSYWRWKEPLYDHHDDEDE